MFVYARVLEHMKGQAETGSRFLGSVAASFTGMIQKGSELVVRIANVPIEKSTSSVKCKNEIRKEISSPFRP